MSQDVSDSDWKLCVRVLQALAKGECGKLENARWKTLLNSVYRKLRKDANRVGEAWPAPKLALAEPSCIQTLRLLAKSVENRQLAVECSRLRPVLWKLRREIRLDLRSEPSPSQSPSLSDAEMAGALAVLQAAKDSPKDIPNNVRPELARALRTIWRQARRDTRRRRLPPHKITPGDCRACERELLRLCNGLLADQDYRMFKGLLAKVARAFEKDIRQGRSSVEEHRTHNAEDAGSSPAGPDFSRKNPHQVLRPAEEDRTHHEEGADSSSTGPDLPPRQTRKRIVEPRPSLIARFFQWIRPR